MKKGGDILKSTQEILKKNIAEGITPKDLDTLAEETILSLGASPAFKGFQGFPCSICTMINSEIVHAIPNNRKLQNGDLFTIDCGVSFEGLIVDAAFSVIVGGDSKNLKRALFSQSVKKALEEGCQQAIAGNTTGDIGYAIEKRIKEDGYTIIPEFTGHGVGKTMHDLPYIPNYGKPGSGTRLEPGMTICIEPIVAAGSPKYKTLKDGWTEVTLDGKDACQWEYCGLVTKSEFEIFA